MNYLAYIHGFLQFSPGHRKILEKLNESYRKNHGEVPPKFDK